MKKLYFTKEEKKKARKKWNKAYYERRKILIETAKRIIADQEKKQSITL
tara:strand:- start:432 stop:578 length:147 start_codon:yes stop_codon:yes gene_type:complete